MLELNQLYNMDCMEGMAQFPDKYFDLAIVDPPYGINAAQMNRGNSVIKPDKSKDWDKKTPDNQYFRELMRISKNQIIWGCNYFPLPPCRGIIFWDKGIYGKTSFSDGELAWTSFDRPLRVAQIRYDGFIGMDDGGRIHPTQKPVALYSWLLQKYAKSGDKIIDTHVGSASSLIACYHGGFEFIGFEIDEHYYSMAKDRYNREISQLKLEAFVPDVAEAEDVQVTFAEMI